MASRKTTLLDAALAEAPPPDNNRKSILDRDDVHEVMREWLQRRAAGERVGTIPWFTEHVLHGKLGIKTGASNVADYMRRKFPEESRRAAR